MLIKLNDQMSQGSVFRMFIFLNKPGGFSKVGMEQRAGQMFGMEHDMISGFKGEAGNG